MSQLKTQEQYESELLDRKIGAKPLEPYAGANTPILHRCVCGNEWKVTPSTALKGTTKCGCGHTRLGISLRKTESQYDRELSNTGVKRLEPYIDGTTPILHRCVCGNEWEVRPHNVLFGRKCGCGFARAGLRCRKRQSEYDKELRNTGVERLAPYVNARAPILHQCLTCKNKWRVSPGHILSGGGCPLCCESKGEKQISKVLAELGLKYDREKRFDTCRNSRPLPFDFYLSEVRVLVEYAGEQHYRPIKWFGGIKKFRYRQHHDRIKRNWARKNGYKLIVVPYTVKNIEAYLEKRIGHLLPVALPLAA